MEYRFECGGETVLVRVDVAGEGFSVSVSGRAYQVKARSERTGELDLTIGEDRRCLVYVAADGLSRWAAPATGEGRGHTYVLTVPDTSRPSRHGRAAGHESLEAQMPGIVRRVLVGAGDVVARGQTLILLEAMKLEIRVTAPHTGAVQRVAVTAGQSVERGQALVELVSSPDPPA